jgi:hypothetical protein
LSNINKKYDILIDALNNADRMMVELGDHKAIVEAVNNKKKGKGKKGTGGMDSKSEKTVAEYFREQIDQKI